MNNQIKKILNKEDDEMVTVSKSEWEQLQKRASSMEQCQKCKSNRSMNGMSICHKCYNIECFFNGIERTELKYSLNR